MEKEHHLSCLLDPFTDPFEESVETANRRPVADHLEVALKSSSEEARKLGGKLTELLTRLAERDGQSTKNISFETTLEDGRPMQALFNVDDTGKNKTLEIEILPIRSDQFGFGTVGTGESGDLCELRVYLGLLPSGLKTLPFFREQKPEHNGGIEADRKSVETQVGQLLESADPATNRDLIAIKSRAMGLYTELLEVVLENVNKHFGADVPKSNG